MLIKDNIIFEEDLFANSHIYSQEEVKEALIELIGTFVAELGIKRLDRVIIKKTIFFDTNLGIANYRNYTIVLANNIAYCLVDKNARFYQRSLAVLKHELYHFQDFQNLLLNRVFKRVPEINVEVLDDFHYWSEFFASFSTFDVCEDEDLYVSFEAVFDKSSSTAQDKKYYTCRLFGYYLHENHSKRCDELIAKHLSDTVLEKTANSFKFVLQNYPKYTAEQLKSIRLTISEVIEKQEDIATYTPVSREDFWNQMLNKSKRKKKWSVRKMNLSKIHHIAIIVSNYEAAKDFYVNKLGFSVIRENYRPERKDWKLDLCVNEYTELEIFAEENPPKRVNRPEACGLRHLAFCVDSVEQTVNELAAVGIECEPIRVDDYTGKKMTFFHDPDGLPLELHE